MYPASSPIPLNVSIGRHPNFHLDARQICDWTVSGARLYRQSIWRRLGEAQEDSTAVLMRGPRQCDKTTLAQFTCAPDVGTWAVSPSTLVGGLWWKCCVVQHMYPATVRRIQLYIQEELDDVLQVEAAKRKRSKASLIRECVAARYGALSRTDTDPLTNLIGTVDIDPVDFDDAVYGK